MLHALTIAADDSPFVEPLRALCDDCGDDLDACTCGEPRAWYVDLTRVDLDDVDLVDLVVLAERIA